MQDKKLNNELHATRDYLRLIGVPEISPKTHPFDPGYDPITVCSHLRQSKSLMASLKISMACWMVAEEESSREKIACANGLGVPVVTGGGPFEIAVAHGKLDQYLALCAGMGVDRIEAGQGFTEMAIPADEVIRKASSFGLNVQFEMGKKHQGEFSDVVIDELIAQGKEWLDAGAGHLVVEARESASEVGLFDENGRLNREAADRFALAFGLDTLVFEAPNKSSQFALLQHFGMDVQLGNIRMEELLRVEIYRRGLHSDAFDEQRVRATSTLTEAQGR